MAPHSLVLLALSIIGSGVARLAAGVRLELHYESLCKQCQIHMAGVMDDVFHGGQEKDSGLMSALNTTIDYYDPSTTEHGDDMLSTDRVHLCAQALAPGNASVWFPFVHCMQMNIDPLKCYTNGHCESTLEFKARLAMVTPVCSYAAGVDLAKILACAEGPEGAQLAEASYNRSRARSADYGFAPVFVNGEYLDGADGFWRKSPDQLLFGKTLLARICDALAQEDPSATPPSTCLNVTTTDQ